jgi:CubicO group peptidase (beta-lactamase class C family)
MRSRFEFSCLPRARRYGDIVGKRSVEAAWKLLVEGYLPFVRTAAGRLKPDVPDPPGTKPNPIPGIAMAVVSLGDKFERTAALGIKRVGTSDLVDESTVFPLASLSKPIGSTIFALLSAERQNKTPTLAWTDTVPNLSIDRPLSYANLFSHRSGLPDHAGDLLEDMGFDRETILSQLGNLALNPLDSYAYTNFGLTAAAVRAAELAGEKWEDLADRLLYQKLGMRSTSSRFDVFNTRKNRTWGHRRGEDGRFFHGPQRNPDQQSPAGGVSSTAKDLLAWMKLQLGDPDTLKKVGLDAASWQKWIGATHHHYLGNEGYGYGWNVKSDENGTVYQLSHSGAFDMGAATNVVLWPLDKIGIVVVTNAEPIGAAEALGAGFQRLLDDTVDLQQLETQKGPGFEHPDQQLTLLANICDSMHAQLRPPRRDAGPPTPGQPFAFDGTYKSEFYGHAVFAREAGQLVMYIGQKTREQDNRYVLAPTDAPNVFVYDSPGEYGAPRNRVEFLRGSDGAPDRVTLWNLFVSYPQSLDAPGDGVCPLDGVVRAWSVTVSKPGKIALTIIHAGDPGIHRVEPTVDVAIGTNRFAGHDLQVRAGDKIGFWSDATEKTYWQRPGANVESLDFEIDREGTFMRV